MTPSVSLSKLEGALSTIQEIVNQRPIYSPKEDESAINWSHRVSVQLRREILGESHKEKSDINRFPEVWAALNDDGSFHAKR